MNTTEKIWHDYHEKLHHFVKRRINDPAAADDILQDIFLKIQRSLDSLKEKTKLQSWLYIASYYCVLFIAPTSIKVRSIYKPFDEGVKMKNTINHEIRKTVRDTYGKIANSPETNYGCSTTSCCDTENKTTARESSLALGYSEEDLSATPEGAILGLGCGNPQVIASLKPGETVLDLGSGGGFDCFLAARTVGAQSHVIGVDMTPELIGKSRHQLANTDFDNVEFRLGEIEHLPVADAIVDVIISNCVINLSPEKEHVFKETFRVLKPGGRLAISDIIAKTELPEDLKNDMRLYTACVAGASSINQLESMLHHIGFEKIQIRPKDTTKVNLGNSNPLDGIEDVVVSATIEAIKPWA